MQYGTHTNIMEQGQARLALLSFAMRLFSVPLVLMFLLSGCASTLDSTRPFFEQRALPPALAAQAPLVDLLALEYAIRMQVNAVRAEQGLSLLKPSNELAVIAAAHSRDMAAQRYFAHTNLRGEDPSARAEKVGLGGPQQIGQRVVEGIGENLFATHLFAEYTVADSGAQAVVYDVIWKSTTDLARETVEAWLQSPTHRANLLCPIFDTQALGIAIGPNQTIFITQNLMLAPATRWAIR